MREQLYWAGTPVPYVTLWSSEVYTHVAPDRNAGGEDAIFSGGGRGIGQPVWAKMEESRQRETVFTRRCQVCNGKLGEDRAFGMDVPQRMQVQGRTMPLLREPPVCRTCARITIDRCPGNRRRYEAGVLECWEVFHYVPIATILGRVEDGGTPELNRVLAPGQTCVGMNKCLLTSFRRLMFEELQREVAA